jgi:two-component system sensor histidine kinase/response regulator
MLGGDIAVESRPNVGSTFRVEVPFDKGETPARIDQATTLEQLRGTRVLIVDDNKTNREILTVMLDNWGFHTHAVSGAQEALALMRSAHETGAPFQLVLTDFQMPGTDGLTLVSQISGDPRLRSAAVLMLSSVDRHLSLTELDRLGVTAYLMKPVIRPELKRVLAQVFRVAAGCAILRTQTAAESATAGPRFRILVAEDNLVNQKLIQALLEKMGCDTVIVPNGMEAVQQANAGGFDAILMDVQMPEVDGLEATRLIRLHESAHRRPPVPIIGVTASAMRSDEDACRLAGMDGYVSKPYQPRLLQTEIHRLVQLRQSEIARERYSPVLRTALSMNSEPSRI